MHRSRRSPAPIFAKAFTSCASISFICTIISLSLLSIFFHSQGVHAQQTTDNDTCYTHLTNADTNQNSILSPTEYLTFVQSYTDGKLDTNDQYGVPIPIVTFRQLPQEFIGIYNYFACGDASVVCPSVEGIDISGADGSDVSSAQERRLLEFSKTVKEAVDELPEVTAQPTGSPIISSPPTVVVGTPDTLSPVAAELTTTVAPTPPPAPTVVETPPPTDDLPPPCPPPYVAGTPYGAGDTVSHKQPGGMDLDASSLESALQGAGGEGGGLFGGGEGGGLFGGEGGGGADSILGGLLGLVESSVVSSAEDAGFGGLLGGVDVYYSYECKPPPYAALCGQPPFEPGMSNGLWEQAWTQQGLCVMEGTTAPTPFDVTTTAPPVSTVPQGTFYPTKSLTQAPTVKPAMPEMPTYPPTGADVSDTVPTTSPTRSVTPVPITRPTVPPIQAGTLKPTPVVNPDDPPYTGKMETTFEYEVFNTEDKDAAAIMADGQYMELLTQSTTEFVESVVVLGMGGTSVPAMTDAGPQKLEGGGVNHSKESELGSSSNGVRRGSSVLVNSNSFGGGGRRRRQRRLEVLLQSDAVSIANVEDVECTDKSLNTPCQKVTAATELTLVKEPKMTTELAFQSVVKRSLEDPGITFPADSAITYAGPSDSMGIIVTPVEKPDAPPVSAPPPEEEEGSSSTPGWVVPVSIGCAAVGAMALVMLAGRQYTKRKRQGIEYQGSTGKRPQLDELEGDLGGGQGGYNNEVLQYGQQTNVSPLDSDLEGGLQQVNNKQQQPYSNPFLNNSNSSSNSDSDSSSSIPSASYSRSFSSSSRGTESSSEDLKNNDNNNSNNAKDFWKQRDQEAMQQEARAQSEGPPHPPESSHDEQDLAAAQSAYRLQTLHEVSDENMSQSNWSLMSDKTNKSDRSVYRAGVEALVKEACPEKIDKIDEMMTEYEGREEVLIGHLSTMLAAKNRSGSGSSEEETDDDERDMHFSTYTSGTDDSGYQSSSMSSGGLRDSTYSALGQSTLEAEQAREAVDMAAAGEVRGSPDIDRGSPDATFDDASPADNAMAAAKQDASPYADAGDDSSSDAGVSSPLSAGAEPYAAGSSAAGQSEVSSLDADEDPGDNVTAAVIAAGSASAAAAAALFDGGDDDESLRSSSASSMSSSSVSSSADSSGWSSDEGLSSLDASSFSTRESNMSDQGIPPGAGLTPDAAALATMGDTSAVGQRVIGNDSKPMFIPVDQPDSLDEENLRSEIATRNDLDNAIEAGDWKAVGATAALIADIPSQEPNEDSLNQTDFNESKMSISTHEQHQVNELEQLVEAGDWTAVMAAANRYENASDLDGSMSDSQPSSRYDDSVTGPEELLARASSRSAPHSSPDHSSRSPSPQQKMSPKTDAVMREAIEELVREVVPEELSNIDEMLIQFQGREMELIATLNSMRRKSDPINEEEEQSNDLTYFPSGFSESSGLSVYENTDKESNISTGGTNPQISNNGTSSSSSADSNPFSPLASSGDSNNDIINTGDTAQDESIVCSGCSRHLPRTEYSDFQLEYEESAQCNECVDLATDDAGGVFPDIAF